MFFNEIKDPDQKFQSISNIYIYFSINDILKLPCGYHAIRMVFLQFRMRIQLGGSVGRYVKGSRT
jgi:hypothetical protein